MTSSLEDVFDLCAKVSNLSLPSYKKHKLLISYDSNEEKIKTVYEGNGPVLPFAASDVFNAMIIHSKCLVEKRIDFKSVYEVTFDIEGSDFKFKPGGTIGVIPHNNVDDCEHVLQCLNVTAKADHTYTLTAAEKCTKAKVPLHIPVKSTLRNVFKQCVDLRCVVKKLFLRVLAQYTEDINERKILEYLCSKEGAPMYTKYVLDNNLCILDILSLFKSCKPPVEVLLENLPRLLPRPYSITNSMSKNKDIIRITFSVMNLCGKKKGLTTGWLESLVLNNIDGAGNGECVPIYLRKSTDFSIPEDHGLPMLLIGPGTGVAPYIGFLEERLCAKANNPTLELGETWLYYGCRDPNVDFLYKAELETFCEMGILSKLCTSYSRVENGGKKYVQNSIKCCAGDIVRLIENGAVVFVCGDLKTMAVQVRQAIVECFVQEHVSTLEDAEKIIRKLEENKQYLVDVWS